MDVQYRPKDWVEMKDGLDQITKDTFVKLFDANRLLADTQGKIQDLDEDRSINFHYKDQTEIIAKLREAYTTLGKFCDEAGQAVYDAIDKPFFVQMDQFAQKMRDVSIKNFETTNRIGFTTITTVQGSSGYGETAQTIKTTKNTITVDDIFKESYAFDEVLRADYEERKRQDPTLKLDYEEYRKHIPSTRGFEYLSIEDDQKKLETWRDFGIGVITIGGLFICPPLGIAAGTVFGILEVKSAYDGEDWETHRKLDKEERVVRGVFGGLDAMSGAGSLMKSAKGIGTLVKLPGDGTNFNPNVGKNMVQSLRDNNTLKNTLIPVGVSWMDTAGIGIKMPVVRFSKVGEIGEDFTKARVIAKDDPYQHIKGSGGSGVSSEGSVVKGTGNIGKEASEAGKHVEEVTIPENMQKWDYPPSDELYKKYENVYKNPKYYNQKTGEIHWPPNDGFVSGTQKVETLQPGTRLDRYGNPAGSFLAPESDSFPSRALAPHSEQAPYYVYEVIDDFEVTLGKIAPWFDQPGGGTQIIKYKSNGRPYSIEELIELEVIKQINP
ncbi:TNT domain-containing protein [Bacillus wiedmannii]|uniref:TNT domain-containing protein n=2 Tax=Bacillus wiedmannii TaxID=1890302 RepID=UPI00211D92EE|nr:TNT domain-containing protein [Bacillus wiedmannii]